MWQTGWEGGRRNSVLSLINYIVQKRHKENPDQVMGDYLWSIFLITQCTLLNTGLNFAINLTPSREDYDLISDRQSDGLY